MDERWYLLCEISERLLSFSKNEKEREKINSAGVSWKNSANTLTFQQHNTLLISRRPMGTKYGTTSAYFDSSFHYYESQDKHGFPVPLLLILSGSTTLCWNHSK